MDDHNACFCDHCGEVLATHLIVSRSRREHYCLECLLNNGFEMDELEEMS